jgi:hypothetical protein
MTGMSRGPSQAPNNGHYALLALLPPAAGVFVWRAAEHLAGLQYTWPTLGAGVLAGIVTGAVVARRVRTSVAATASATGVALVLAAEIVVGAAGGRAGPATLVGLTDSFVAGLLLAGEVVLALWMHGNYRLEVGHRVSVWLLAGSTGDDPDYYQARCECTWSSDWFVMEDGDDSEERAFEVAHQHSPTVRTDIAVQL